MSTKRLRAVIYCRVSSDKQRDKHTIESQLVELPLLAARCGWDLVAPPHAYVDDGFTAKAGFLAERLAFQRLMQDAGAGKFDVLVVVDADRLTRSEDAAERGFIIGAFQRVGVQIATLTGGGALIDLQTFHGEMQFTMSAMVAAEDNKKRRTRAVIARRVAIEAGRKPAGKSPFGLAWDKGTREWSLRTKEQAIMVEMFERVADGDSCGNIAADFTARELSRKGNGRGSRWQREHIWKMIRSTTYRGEWKVDGTVIKVPACVSPELWARANDALTSRGKRLPKIKKRHVYLLEGLALCGSCGAPMTIASGSAPGSAGTGKHGIHHPRYVCRHRRHKHMGKPCAMPRQRTSEIDARVWDALVSMIEHPGVLESYLGKRKGRASQGAGQWSEDLKDWRKRLRRLDDMEDTVCAQHRRGTLSARAYTKELAALAKEREVLERQIATAERAERSESMRVERVVKAEKLIAQLRERMGTLDASERRSILLLLSDPGDWVIHSGKAEGTIKLRIHAEGNGDMVHSLLPSPCKTSHGMHQIEIRVAA